MVPRMVLNKKTLVHNVGKINTCLRYFKLQSKCSIIITFQRLQYFKVNLKEFFFKVMDDFSK